jgi:hypothetical protein
MYPSLSEQQQQQVVEALLTAAQVSEGDVATAEVTQ